MSELTKEWLLKTIAELEEERDAVPGAVNEDAAMALAAMKLAMASLEVEAVAWIVHARTGDQLTTDGGYVANAEGILGLHSTPLYTAPPAPVVPDEKPVPNPLKMYAVDAVAAIAEVRGWNACRAAMLQGVENAETPTTMQTAPALDSSPKIAESPTGINQGKSEPVTTANKLPFEQWLSQQTGTIDVECGCVMTEVFFHWLRVAYEAGNYPVIPDGWVLVPIEPTYQMCEAMGLQWESPRFPDRYKAMLAAVKK
ncbi:TPA: hypothetical protein ACPEUG_002741 [Enterobacter hormaechei]